MLDDKTKVWGSSYFNESEFSIDKNKEIIPKLKNSKKYMIQFHKE